MNYFATAKFTNKRFTQELKGMAQTSNVPYIQLRRLNLIPELIKAQCSTLGAWGPATTTGKLFQLRALDW
jgi:hypothetical protein